MKIIIAGGSGFLGRALTESFLADGHEMYVLTRSKRNFEKFHSVIWDGKTANGWGHLMNEMDMVINVSGKSTDDWPWTKSKKQKFLDSRVLPGLALTEAIQQATHRPGIFVQQSGINYYGLDGELADESTPPADDFMAQLGVKWEASTKPLDDLGVRRVVIRTSIVIDKHGGLFPLMALPVRLFVGGPYGDGKHAVPWIHLKDYVAVVRFLVENEKAQGVYNLIAPQPTSNAEFNKTIAEVIHRPYWFPYPAFLMRFILGEMGIMVLKGRFSQPKRLLDAGFQYQFPHLREALVDLIG